MQQSWLQPYPADVPSNISNGQFPSLLALLQDSVRRHRHLPACRFMGRSLSYGQLDIHADALAAWLQARGLVRGDRVAVMLPNVPQYLVAVLAILRAGCVVVNVNPQFGPRELEHQLRDSGAKAIVIIENAAATLQQVLASVPTRHVLLASLGDLLGVVRGRLVNQLARRMHRQVPGYALPQAVPFNHALAAGRRLAVVPAQPGPDDIALLQYTGGTTGTSKGAVLLHRNLVASVLQTETWSRPVLAHMAPGEQPVVVCALPLHQIFAFGVVLLLGLHTGACSLMIPHARDTAGMLKALSRQRFHIFPGVDALYDALASHRDFDKVDWSGLKLCISGATAVQPAAARRWQARTGCPVCEGYGLTETGAVATCNPVDGTEYSGHIGSPLPGTELSLLDDAGRPVARGMPGEIAIRGPQVMAGYWQRPDETAKAVMADGWFRSGDIGVMDARGCVRIVDRKKDLIRVSGFNVYPNEVEDVVTQLPGVAECAAVGVRDGPAGEAVKLVVVRREDAANSPTEDDIRAYCETHLSGYKRPRVVEFRKELPKTPVGKVLRRELRERA